MYAVIETGAKQYKVAVGDKIEVELLASDVNKVIKFRDILNGGEVSAKVVEHGKGEKINIFKYKSKKNVRKRMGHRQPYTLLEITEVKNGK